MIPDNLGRTWGNAPVGVRNARALAWLGTLFTVGSTLAFLGFYSLLFPFYIWLLVGLKRGTKAAYYVQMILSIVGLIGFPIGTLINGYILATWFRPETKAWFGV